MPTPPADPPPGSPGPGDPRLAGVVPAGPGGGLDARLATIRGRWWYRPLARAPMWLWRLGLGGLLGQAFALLTTTGRRTGLPRTTMVACLAAGDRRYVVAVYGPGSQWFRNLVADPRVSVQTAGGSRAMLAHRLTGEQELRRAYTDLHGRLGRLTDVGLGVLGVDGGLDGLLAHPGQVLLVGLEETGTPAPPAARPDLAWVLPTAAAAWWLLRRRRR